MTTLARHPQLDEWLPRPTVRVVHSRESSASAERLWTEASRLRLDDCAALGRLVRWKIADLDPELTFERMLHEPPFVALHESHHRVLSGLAGPIWSLRRVYPHFKEPEEYRAWDDAGTARVLFGIWAQPTSIGSRLTVEVRVEALGARGRVGVTALGPLIRSCEHLLGAEALRAAAQRAEHPTEK